MNRNQNIVGLHQMHFQVRLPCIDVGVCKSEDCSKYPFNSGQYVADENECGNEIPAIAGLPGASECCCPKAQLHLLRSTQELARNVKQVELDGIWNTLMKTSMDTSMDLSPNIKPFLDATQLNPNSVEINAVKVTNYVDKEYWIEDHAVLLPSQESFHHLMPHLTLISVYID
eukprot:Protomagalhaensia_sp_Gyna_25__2231@NODE_2214_length_1218_cov_203_139101_g1835_i0_p1_GENE_NODE_2214_length_1218_cov_203_139101_g1835_i0NODE_2214_length_1218_cov_203_139101_g1835_i0_p1_ORF_typecomplete_len172_score16_09_NODE_2214_length_1218_cov_203_139101_g1835_i079594